MRVASPRPCIYTVRKKIIILFKCWRCLKSIYHLAILFSLARRRDTMFVVFSCLKNDCWSYTTLSDELTKRWWDWKPVQFFLLYCYRGICKYIGGIFGVVINYNAESLLHHVAKTRHCCCCISCDEILSSYKWFVR